MKLRRSSVFDVEFRHRHHSVDFSTASWKTLYKWWTINVCSETTLFPCCLLLPALQWVNQASSGSSHSCATDVVVVDVGRCVSMWRWATWRITRYNELVMNTPFNYVYTTMGLITLIQKWAQHNGDRFDASHPLEFGDSFDSQMSYCQLCGHVHYIIDDRQPWMTERWRENGVTRLYTAGDVTVTSQWRHSDVDENKWAAVRK